MKTSYYIPGLNFTKDAPMDFLLMVAHNTVQYKLDGYHVVGLTYPTKEELLNDMPRYATTWGLN